MYTSILCNRINKYLDLLGVIAEEPNGFRSKRSCEDHIYSLTSAIKYRKSKNLDTFAAFIDMTKAFDSVNRNLLFYKLLRYNIEGKIYVAIKALYTKTSACINLNGHLSHWFETFIGVRQGDNLSPMLFNIFLNDLATEINSLGLGIKIGNLKLSILMYADDIVLLSDTAENLQKLLNHVYEWCRKWQLSINPVKTEVMHFHKKNKSRSQVQFFVGSENIKVVPKYKYLGVILDEFCTFQECATTLAESAGRGLCAIIARFKQLKGCEYKTFYKLYNSSVVSVFSYAAGIWGYNRGGPAQKIYNRALRYFMGVNKFTANLFLQGDSGWLSPEYIFRLAMLRYWNRLCKLDNSFICKQIFNYEIDNLKKYTWVFNIKQIFMSLNLLSHFNEKKSVDLSICNKLLLKIMQEDWETKLPKKPKLREYQRFKEHLDLEEYLYLPKHKRSLIAKIRSGTLPLAIETGRYSNIPLENRLCTLCNSKLIESEFHFMCICSKFEIIRKKYFAQYSAKWLDFEMSDSETKFLYIMKNHQKILGNFIVELWEYRKELLFK